MATSIVTQIVPFLAALLRTEITIANGASFDSRQVFEVMPNDATLDNEALQPCIFIWRGVEGKTLNEHIGGIDSELDIHIVVSGQSCYSAGDVGAEMASDVDRVLMAGTPFDVGGALVNIEPVSCTVAVSDIDLFQPGAYSQYLAKFCCSIEDPKVPWLTA